ncbi:MAG TPA: NAD(P)-binding domain-containing protein [Terriglobia bacterium]|nr:NAD(P)-binding domain-containing protein [Terriglobia bacterium]
MNTLAGELMLSKIVETVQAIFASANMTERRPALKSHQESNVPGLYVIGDLAGAPVIKLAMEQGYNVIQHIASKPDARSGDRGVYDVIVVGAGAAGLNAGLAAREKGLHTLILEKNKIANTIEDFPEGKWVYAEPDQQPPKGKLWLDGARKEDLVRRWHQIIRDNQMEVHVEEGLKSLERLKDGGFRLTSDKAEYRAKRVILATGQRGNPRRLMVPGEEQERVYHRLYSPKEYQGEEILIVGGGNSAAEAAITLSQHNQVTLSYRGNQFYRLFKDNSRLLEDAAARGRLKTCLNSTVLDFGDKVAAVQVEREGKKSVEQIPFDHAFVLIGSEFPGKFLKSLGLRLENEWNGSWLRAAGLTLAVLLGLWIFGGQSGLRSIQHLSTLLGGLVALAAIGALVVTGLRGDRFSWLGVSFLVCYTIYGVKTTSPGMEYWPYRGWGFNFLSVFGRSASFWYDVLYSVVMTVFGIAALKRWGLDRKDKFQIWRYVSLLGFQWVFFFIIPEFLFEWAIKYQWVGERLAHDPAFAGQAWRSYGIVYAWPLFFYTFFGDPSKIWVIWGVLLAFGIIPLFVLWHGKRYCSWICGCGGLAETLGDRWRHLAPKGKSSKRWEQMNLVILVLAVIVTLAVLLHDAVAFLRGPGTWGLEFYHVLADIWLVGIIPVTLYPFLGGKVWCRYWCPLAKMMELFSHAYAKLGISRYRIEANEKCIACTECSRNCLVGIDVMSFALKQQPITNANSSCIGCGICVTVCPMDVLSFGRGKPTSDLIQIKRPAPQRPASPLEA